MPTWFERCPVGGLVGCALSLGFSLGCSLAYPNLSVAPLPSQAQIDALNTVQSRSLPVPSTQVFPKVLGVLMDMGYQVRCANQELGQVNIYQTWYDETRAARPELSMEATLLFQTEGTGSTRVRIVATGRWNLISVGRHGDATVTGARPALDSGECKRFLEQLEARLCPPPAPGR